MRIHVVSKGPLEQISGGYLYNKYLVEHLRERELAVRYHPDGTGLATASERDVVIVDSLVLADLATQLLTVPARLVLLLHMAPDPRALGADGACLLAALYRRSRVVVTGNSMLTALRDDLALQGVDAVRIEPGVPQHWRVKQRYSDRAQRLLGVANYLPGKGIARLIEVLAPLRHLSWTLTVRGNPDFDPDFHRSMLELVAHNGLEDRVALLGSVPHDAVNDEMIAADLLVHLSEHESYSMATAEAIACGLPVLSYPTGDAETFGRSGLVRHVACSTEQHALRALIADTHHYGNLRRRGPREVRTWEQVGREFVDWLEP
jgi:glycosyltransferase involved in cell wall biosynthesis